MIIHSVLWYVLITYNFSSFFTAFPNLSECGGSNLGHRQFPGEFRSGFGGEPGRSDDWWMDVESSRMDVLVSMGVE